MSTLMTLGYGDVLLRPSVSVGQIGWSPWNPCIRYCGLLEAACACPLRPQPQPADRDHLLRIELAQHQIFLIATAL